MKHIEFAPVVNQIHVLLYNWANAPCASVSILSSDVVGTFPWGGGGGDLPNHDKEMHKIITPVQCCQLSGFPVKSRGFQRLSGEEFFPLAASGKSRGFDNSYSGNLADFQKIIIRKITVLLETKYGTVFKFRIDGPGFNYWLSRIEDGNTRVFYK